MFRDELQLTEIHNKYDLIERLQSNPLPYKENAKGSLMCKIYLLHQYTILYFSFFEEQEIRIRVYLC